MAVNHATLRPHHPMFYHAALLIEGKDNVIAIAKNRKGMCAERILLQKIREDVKLHKTWVLSLRANTSKNIKNGKPCGKCTRELARKRIAHVAYSNSFGEIEWLW